MKSKNNKSLDGKPGVEFQPQYSLKAGGRGLIRFHHCEKYPRQTHKKGKFAVACAFLGFIPVFQLCCFEPAQWARTQCREHVPEACLLNSWESGRKRKRRSWVPRVSFKGTLLVTSFSPWGFHLLKASHSLGLKSTVAPNKKARHYWRSSSSLRALGVSVVPTLAQVLGTPEEAKRRGRKKREKKGSMLGHDHMHVKVMCACTYGGQNWAPFCWQRLMSHPVMQPFSPNKTQRPSLIINWLAY